MGILIESEEPELTGHDIGDGAHHLKRSHTTSDESLMDETAVMKTRS